jgi:hypothetical protein
MGYQWGQPVKRRRGYRTIYLEGARLVVGRRAEVDVLLVDEPARRPPGRNWRLERLTRCQRCNGRGEYRSHRGETVSCGPCRGTGRVPVFQGTLGL